MIYWYGMLTTSNIHEVVERLRGLLTGRTYTFVAVNEGLGFVPDVRVRCTLTNGKSGEPFSVWGKDGHAGFNVCDTGGVWGCTTSLANEAAYDPEFRNPYLVFNGDRVTIQHRDRVTIQHRAPAGHRLIWAVVAEPKVSE